MNIEYRRIDCPRIRHARSSNYQIYRPNTRQLRDTWNRPPKRHLILFQTLINFTMSHKCRYETNQRKIESRIIQFQRFLLWYVKEKRESLREREMTTDSRDGNLEPPSPIFPGLTPKHFLSTEETSPSGKLRQLPSKSGRRVSSMFLVYPNPASKDR